MSRSLDTKASLIFASAAQHLEGTPVEFTVTRSDATVAAATGFSDDSGGYTVTRGGSDGQVTGGLQRR